LFSGSSSNNIAIGFAAGPSTLTDESNKLYIASGSGTPLIKGDFAAKTVNISGSLIATSFTGSLQGTASFATNAVSASYAPDTTFPYTGSALITGSLGVNGNIGVYGDKFLVQASGSTLNVGESTLGNITTNYAQFPGDTSILNGATLAEGELFVKGTIIYGETSQVACVAGQLMSFNETTSKWKLTDADDDSATKLLGIALNNSLANGDIALLLEGIATTGEFNGTIKVGDVLYSSVSAGSFDFTPPTAAGDYVRGVGWCLKESGGLITVFFQPDCTWLEL
jgi:hypothetical protein